MFAKHMSKAEEEKGEIEDVVLNLTPMIDVLTTLLFFLLLSFGAIVVALINVSIPALSEGTDENEPEKDTKVTMSVLINEKGFIVSGASDKLSEEESKKLGRSIPVTGDGYDFPTLTAFLYEVKRKYPKSDSVVLTPEPDIPYETLIKTLDATREREGNNQEGRAVRMPLFTGAVVSTLVK
jgi:biopolymer transport protein ExbD